MEADQVGGFIHLFIYFSIVSLSLPWFSSTWSIVRGVEIQATVKDSSLSRKGPFQPLFFKKKKSLYTGNQSIKPELAIRAQTCQRE